MDRRLRSVAAVAIALLSSPLAALAQVARSAAPPPRASLTPTPPSHAATRLLVARSVKLNKIGWLEAETTFTPGEGVRYRVLAEGGDKGIRNRVLRKVLDGEVEMSAPVAAARAALNDSNYQLVADTSSQTIRLAPRRREPTLIDGSAVVDARGRLMRIEGKLAKSPSFWVRSIRVARTYQAIDGVALPVHVESVADVKLAGTCEFSMWIDYTTVDGRRLERTVTRPHPATVDAAPLLVAVQQPAR